MLPVVLPERLAIELETRIREGWTGRLWLNFKDGHVWVEERKGPRSEKRSVRID